MNRKIVEGLRAGKSANKLSKELGTCKKTISRVRAQAQERGYLDTSLPLPPYPERLFPECIDRRNQRTCPTDELLVPHLEYIKEKLSIGWYPITIYEELSVSVPLASFYRFLKRHNLTDTGKQLRVVPEIISSPGQCLQIDWGKLRDVEVDGKKKTVWMLTGVLGFSRYRMVRLVWSTSLSDTLDALRSMFDEMGGVPERIVSDNEKCLVVPERIVSDNEKCLVHKASRYEAVLNPTLARFATHYGTLLEALPPRQPQKKGKVERQIPYMRRLYQAHGEDWWGLEESQNYFNKKLALANSKPHGTTRQRPTEAFEQLEKASLKKLPTSPYDIEHYHRGKVRQDGHVRFQNKYYSVEEKYIGKSVVVLGNSTTVCIYHEGNLLEVHQRITDAFTSKSTKKNHLKPWERTFEEESVYRTRARALGEWVEEIVITILASHQGFIDTRKIWGILSLDKSFDPELINEACRVAVEQEAFSYWKVRSLAEEMTIEAHTAPSSPAPVPACGKYVHSIDQYSNRVQLTLLQGGNNESRNGKITTQDPAPKNCSKGA